MISSNCTEWFGKCSHHAKAIQTRTTVFTPLQHDAASSLTSIFTQSEKATSLFLLFSFVDLIVFFFLL